MNRLSSKIYLLTFILCLSSFISFSVKPENSELTGRWNFVSFYDTLTKLEECPKTIKENAFYIEFDPDGKQGIIQGFSSRNFLYGEYLIDSIINFRFKNMWGTKVNELTKCGHMFYDAYLNFTSVKQRGDSLFVTYGDANKLIKFVKVK